LLHQPLDELGAARGRRLVVVIAHFLRAALAADLDAAFVVDLAYGEVVAVFCIDAVEGVFAGERHGRAERDIFSTQSGLGAEDG
jgi:hypothetical protein